MQTVKELFLPSLLTVVALTCCASLSAQDSPRPLNVDDEFRLAGVSDPQLSPDGDWAAYTVSRRDLEEDESSSQVFMISMQGGTPIAMTSEDESSSHPRWSPDGRYLAFLSSRDEGPTRVWLLYRGGGEARAITDTPQSVSSFEWSPDGTRLALLMKDATGAEIREHEGDDEEKARPPWVIDREQFKQDYIGYLDRRRTQLYVLDVASEELEPLTSGDYDVSQPVWSPDGSRIAFTSNRTAEPDQNYNSDIWTVSSDPAQSGLVQVTSNPGADSSPAWSPDGQNIAHLTEGNPEAIVYATSDVAVTPASGGDTRWLDSQMDHWTFAPRFSPDGQYVIFRVEDRGQSALGRVPANGGRWEKLVGGENAVSTFDIGLDGTLLLGINRAQQPTELFTWKDGTLNQLTQTNAEVLAELALGSREYVTFNSADGTEIGGFVVKPHDFQEGKRYPIVLDIHGGPVSQYDSGWHFESQLYAANGYIVVHPNPRGSSGYGEDFSLAIWQDWGGPDYHDVMAAVDYVIEQGWGDPDRMAVTGWSYGGMLTNHVITKTNRFKAAATGASATLYTVNYGHDQYQRWWEKELGFPWEPESRAIYERMSPFNQVDKVTTPTLILSGEIDWNVPVINSEQLYLALKRQGIDTQLVVYPGEYHGISTPSYRKDLYERYLGWFNTYLGGE